MFSVQFEAGNALVQVEVHAMLLECVLDGGHYFGVDHGHDLAQFFNKRYLDATFQQVFGDFHADVAAANHRGAGGLLSFDPLTQHAAFRNGPQREYPRQVNARNVGADWFGAGRQHELIVGFAVGVAVGPITYFDAATFPVDGRNLAVQTNLDVEALSEQLGAGDDQVILVFDDITHVIW